MNESMRLLRNYTRKTLAGDARPSPNAFCTPRAMAAEGRPTDAARSPCATDCSINTWLRGPGITTFCALCIACWSRPYPGTPPEHMLPQYLFWPIIGIIFFNGQYYAQRVIGKCAHAGFPLHARTPACPSTLARAHQRISLLLVGAFCTASSAAGESGVAHAYPTHTRRAARCGVRSYYIRKAQDYAKRGITHVELHAS